jgi:hypothetical protein
VALEKPDWLALLTPLPRDAKPERKPVASAEQLASGTAGPIAGWQSLSLHLSVPEGSRHLLITVDAAGKLLSAGDHVMLVTSQRRDGKVFNIYDHESVGGRFAEDGSFHGTRWITHTEQEDGADDDAATMTSTSSKPSEEDITALNRLVADVMTRAS